MIQINPEQSVLGVQLTPGYTGKGHLEADEFVPGSGPLVVVPGGGPLVVVPGGGLVGPELPKIIIVSKLLHSVCQDC